MIKPELLVPQVNTVGLVAHYKLWAGLTTTTTVFDYSLNGFTGTVSGTNIVPAYPGFTFNDTDDVIDIGSGPGAVSTVLMWVNPTDVAGTDHPISLSSAILLKIVTGTLEAEGFTGGVSILYIDGIAATTVTANWHLIGITDTVAKNASNLDIGRERSRRFAGIIGDTMLFDRVLTAADVKSIYSITRWRYGV